MWQKYTHTLGSKSFARVREDERKKRTNGEEPSEIDMFVLTRKRKDGTMKLDEETKVELEQLTSQSHDTPKSSNARENFIKKIFKPHPGRAPLHGKGVTLSDLREKSTTQASNEVLQELAAREKKAIEMEEKFERMMLGLKSIVAQIQHTYPGVEIPPEMMESPLANRHQPPDAGSAPRVD
ncbi:uncharacterized protein LOC120012461 [Tripterygium wilfordii]|uniref:uncharacterized protein LOC120012461 n=1 Tax=Tripterygium wilfordii TaxID=458696 RepID=UPI0018F85AEA|nr:uncharacterized protein LOC120012461 [Tripterygium wilfordii]